MSYENSWQFFFQPSDRVMALPCWKRPRLYVVSKNWKQRWDDSSFYPAFKLRAKCFKLVVRVLAMCGLLRVRRSVSGGETFHTGCRLVVLRGAEGPAQKLIARVVDETTAKTVAYIKYAGTAVARSKVDAEYRILKALADQNAAISPSIKKYGSFGGGTALEISAVEGKMLPAKLPEAPEISGLMSEIREFLDQLRVSDELFEIDNHPAVLRIRKEVAEIGGQRSEISDQRSGVVPDFRPLTADFLDTLLAPLRAQKWPVVIQHGDFTPWNVLRTSDVRCQRSDVRKNGHILRSTSNIPQSSTLCAIDWEEGTTEGFPNFDFIYFVLQTGCLIHSWKPQQAFDYLISRLADDGLSASEVSSLIKLCALDAYFRFGSESGNPKLQSFRMQTFTHAVVE